MNLGPLCSDLIPLTWAYGLMLHYLSTKSQSLKLYKFEQSS